VAILREGFLSRFFLNRFLGCGLRGLIAVALLGLLAPVCLADNSAQQDPARPDFSREGAVIEQITTRVVFQSDGTSVREQHARMRVNSEAGVQQYGLLPFPYQASVENKVKKIKRRSNSNIN